MCITYSLVKRAYSLASIRWRIPTYTDVWRRVLRDSTASVDVCWRMLTWTHKRICIMIHILLWKEYVLNMHHIFSQQYWYHTFCPSTVIDQLLDWNVQVRTSQRPVGWRSLVIVPIYVFSLHCYPRKPDKHLFGGVTPPPLSHHLMDDREQGNISRLICWFDYQNQAF